MSRRRHKHEEPEDEAWLMTYADMITLLMCFFIIMLTVMEPKKDSAFDAMSQALKEEFSKKDQKAEAKESAIVTASKAIQAMIESDTLEQVMAVEETEKGIMLELASSAFFASGSANTLPKAEPILDNLSHILFDFDAEDYIIEVQGHTDDVDIKTAQFPSNWELSAGRASSVVRFFIDRGHEKSQLRAVGLADTDPKVPNEDEFGNAIPENREMNRRVVIRVERREQ